MNSNENKDAYNNYLQLPMFPHRVIDFLISSKSESAEMIWKILKYNDIDALSKPNLTFEEKNELRWLGQSQQNKYKIFLKPTIGDALVSAENQTFMKMYRIRNYPDSNLISTVDFEIDFLTNEQTSILKYQDVIVEKTDLLEVLFLDLFNGKDIGIGSSMLSFDRGKSRLAQSSLDIGDNKTFFGRALIMSIKYMDSQTGGICT